MIFMVEFSFEILARDKNSRARTGLIKTRRGTIETPYVVPVATCAAVRGLDSADLGKIGTQCVLANTYHLHLQPGDEKIRKLNGLHGFMNYNKPIFTDSGGYQAFSLGAGTLYGVRKIGHFPEGKKPKDIKKEKELHAQVSDKGVRFKSIYDGSYQLMNPEISMRIQSNLGSDIIMAFDECTSQLHDYSYVRTSMERTHRWALDSLRYHNKEQALYGIIQGGFFQDLRNESTRFIKNLENDGIRFDGIAIGGSLGDTKKDMHQILEWIIPELENDDRPRHLLGIGWVDDIFECVERGIDTFDCVQMTRTARHGELYINPENGGSKKNKFRIEIEKTKYNEDERKIDENCNCHTCQYHTRAYLHHLYKINEFSYFRLATIHNTHFILDLMSQIRESIKDGSFTELKEKWLGGN